MQVARDGSQALDMFDAVKPDLVLLDVMLPKVSGIDVCRELRVAAGCRSSWSPPRGRDRHRGRPGGRCRRLRHQAVPAARARGPGAGGARRTPTDNHDAVLSGEVLSVGDVSSIPSDTR